MINKVNWNSNCPALESWGLGYGWCLVFNNTFASISRYSHIRSASWNLGRRASISTRLHTYL